MRAANLVPLMASYLGLEQEDAARIDRFNAEAGLRARGKGRAVPDMTLKERMIFLLGCMGVQHVTKAAVQAKEWSEALGVVNVRPTLRELDPDGWDPSPLQDHEEIIFIDRLEPILAPHRREGRMGLVDYLCVICPLLEDGRLEPELVALTLDLTNGIATVEHGERGSPLSTDRFYTHRYVGPVEVPKPAKASKLNKHTATEPWQPSLHTTRILRSATIGGEGLRAIATTDTSARFSSGIEAPMSG